MKKYRDEYDDDNEVEQETFVTQQPVVVDKLSFSDYLIAAALGGVVFCLLLFWAFPMIEPSVWQETAEAVGTRPHGRELVYPKGRVGDRKAPVIGTCQSKVEKLRLFQRERLINS